MAENSKYDLLDGGVGSETAQKSAENSPSGSASQGSSGENAGMGQPKVPEAGDAAKNPSRWDGIKAKAGDAAKSAGTAIKERGKETALNAANGMINSGFSGDGSNAGNDAASEASSEANKQVRDTIDTVKNAKDTIDTVKDTADRVKSTYERIKAHNSAEGAKAISGGTGTSAAGAGAGAEATTAGAAGAEAGAAGAGAGSAATTAATATEAGAATAAAGGATAGGAAGGAAAGGAAATIGWPIIIILIGIIFLLLLAYVFTSADKEEKIAEGSYAALTKANTDETTASIIQTWNGLYYRKYAEMSVYAYVDTSNVQGEDPFTDMNYKALTGVDLSKIDEEKMYQEGTKEWADLKIADINASEKYLQISGSTLATIDSTINNGYMYPKQIIKPVYADCFADFSTIEDLAKCKVRNVREEDDEEGKKGEPVPITDEEVIGDVGDEDLYWRDKSLYLTYAKSQKFVRDDTSESETGYARYKIAVDEKGNPEKVTGQWDYGLGTVARYVGYFQPSKVTGYHIQELDVFCTGNGVAGNGIPIAECEGKKFGEAVQIKHIVDSEVHNTVGELYQKKECLTDEDVAEGCGGGLIFPSDEIIYKNWEPKYQIYSKEIEKYNDKKDEIIYDGSDTKGEYYVTKVMSATESAEAQQEAAAAEPGVSTGVPKTEVKYIIDYALTFGGSTKFEVDQAWVKQADAEHIQLLHREIAADIKADVKTSLNESSLFHLDTKNTRIKDEKAEACVYYGGQFTGYCYDTSEFLHVVLRKKEVIPNDILVSDGYTCPADAPPTCQSTPPEYKDRIIITPEHYEDSEGRAFYEGKRVKASELEKDATGNESGVKDDDLSKYTWGAKLVGTISSYKLGDLVTYTPYYKNPNPKSEDAVGTAYLDDYLSNYVAYIPAGQIGEDGSTYETVYYEGVASGDWFDDSTNTIKDFSSAVNPDLEPTDKVNNLTTFAYDRNLDGHAMESLGVEEKSLLQLAAFAGKMGFKANMGPVEDIEFSLNHIKDSAGLLEYQNKTRMSKIIELYHDDFENFAGMYGVDPYLLAAIAAQKGDTTGNIMGLEEGEYTAYNLGLRAITTEKFGGSYESDGTNDNPKTFEGLVNYYKNLFDDYAVVDRYESVEEKSKETVYYNPEEGTGISRPGEVSYKKAIGRETPTPDPENPEEIPEEENGRWDPTDPRWHEIPSGDGGDLGFVGAAEPDPESGTSWLVKVYMNQNVVVVYKNDIVQKRFICSTGANPASNYASWWNKKMTDAPPAGCGFFADSNGNVTGLRCELGQERSNHWVDLSGGVNSPAYIRIYGQGIWFHSVPFTEKSRDTLKEGQWEKLGQGASEGCVRMQLSDLKWLYNNVPSGAVVIMTKSAYTGPMPTAASMNRTSTETSKSDKATYTQPGTDGELSEENKLPLTPEQVSIKVAAMYLQALQREFNYNMPMVIEAYGLGNEYVNKILETYEYVTSTTIETLLDDDKDTAWADLRKHVYCGEYNSMDKLNRYGANYCSADEVFNDNEENWPYAERVLGYINQPGIRYQRIDERFLDITDGDMKSDNVQHSSGTWLFGNLKNSRDNKNITKNFGTETNVDRAWNLLTKETGDITEEDWTELTFAREEFPLRTWALNGNSPDVAVLYKNEGNYERIEYTPEAITMNDIVSELMRFGTDEVRGEEDYIDNDFLKSQYSRMYGSDARTWDSIMKAEDFFGVDKAGETIDRTDFVTYKPEVVRRYGYETDDYKTRDYSYETVYHMLKKDDLNIYNPFNGEVYDIGENENGKYVVIKVDNFLDKDIYVTISRLNDIYFDHDAIGTPLRYNPNQASASAFKIGSPSVIDGEYYFGMAISEGSVNGPYLDFDKIFKSFPQTEFGYSILDDNPSYNLSPFAPIGGINDPDFDPGDPMMGEDISDWGPIDALLGSWGNEAAKGQCVGYVAYLIYQNFGLENATAGPSYASEVAKELGKFTEFTYYSGKVTPTAGSVISLQHGPHIAFVNKVSDEGIWISDGNCGGWIDSNYNGMIDSSEKHHGKIRTNRFLTWDAYDREYTASRVVGIAIANR